MTTVFEVYPENPQPRIIKQAADMLRKGAAVKCTVSHGAHRKGA